jgi:mxaA protein
LVAVGARLAGLQREVVVLVPPGWQLDEASLPQPGGRGTAIELRQVQRAVRSDSLGQRHTLSLRYQVFLAPPEVRTLETPPFRLRVTRPGRREELLVEAWPVTVAPLLPPEVSPRRGLGTLQPEREPPLIDTGPQRLRLRLYAALAGGLLGSLGWIYLGPPWRAARQRPFGRALRQLRSCPAQANDAQWQAACRTLHTALNRAAGQVVLGPGLDAFVQAHPAYAKQQADLARFLALSNRSFFGDGRREPGDMAWLLGLCRRCFDAERGLG